jgi:sorbitol-specific phosphotransferase system component IIA
MTTPIQLMNSKLSEAGHILTRFDGDSSEMYAPALHHMTLNF